MNRWVSRDCGIHVRKFVSQRRQLLENLEQTRARLEFRHMTLAGEEQAQVHILLLLLSRVQSREEVLRWVSEH